MSPTRIHPRRQLAPLPSRHAVISAAVEPLEPRRFLAAGDLDPTFGTGGRVVTDLHTYWEDAADVVAAPGGGVYVVGHVNGHPWLAKYTAAGALDSTFGNGMGYVVGPSGYTAANALAVQPDGKILVAGAHYPSSAPGSHFAVARYTPAGAIDTTWGGGDGIATASYVDGALHSSANALAVQADGKVVVAGKVDDRGFGVARLDAAGALDSSFSNDGRALQAFFGYTSAEGAVDVAISAGGKITLAGSVRASGATSVGVARLNPDGSGDAAFGQGGARTIAGASASAVAVDAAGNTLIAGGAEQDKMLVLRLTPGGATDTNFGTGGTFAADAGPYTWGGQDVALAPNGRILLVGAIGDAAGAGIDLALIALDAAGWPDTTFGTQGRVLTDFGGAREQGKGVAVLSDGRIVAAGWAVRPDDKVDIILARYQGWPATPPPTGYAGTPFSGTPISIAATGTTTLQVESFDNGGQGVAYHDTTAANDGGSNYRGATGADLETISDGIAGVGAGYVKAGEWLRYTVNVAQAGAYNVGFRVASLKAGGSMHLEVDGVKVGNSIGVPDTTAWNAWRTITLSNVQLPAGQHVLTLKFDTNGAIGYVGNLNHMTFTKATVTPPPPPPQPTYAGTPFRGTPAKVNATGASTIEAEQFDEGGQGVAYHDTDTANLGKTTYRAGGVDVEAINDGGAAGYAVGFVKAGEWLKYTVDVAADGTYNLDVRLASLTGGGAFHVEVDGVRLAPNVTVPKTGAWGTYATARQPAVTLKVGRHVVTLKFDANGSTGYVANFNWMRFTRR